MSKPENFLKKLNKIKLS